MAVFCMDFWYFVFPSIFPRLIKIFQYRYTNIIDLKKTRKKFRQVLWILKQGIIPSILFSDSQCEIIARWEWNNNKPFLDRQDWKSFTTHRFERAKYHHQTLSSRHHIQISALQTQVFQAFKVPNNYSSWQRFNGTNNIKVFQKYHMFSVDIWTDRCRCWSLRMHLEKMMGLDDIHRNVSSC